ncbi:hypothetical protein RF11_00187 [Thelohanellus kitauei]|uniref:Uncharacterized protein n=1 Tax=Thelohanellus kitauei TaxID=669202 RepID=A0A0C2N8Z2_THEKT|nr:hypothetical protein RF11_00187 [Thelohanellus kitauei]
MYLLRKVLLRNVFGNNFVRSRVLRRNVLLRNVMESSKQHISEYVGVGEVADVRGVADFLRLSCYTKFAEKPTRSPSLGSWSRPYGEFLRSPFSRTSKGICTHDIRFKSNDDSSQVGKGSRL